MSNPMIRTQFPDSQLETALPGLKEITFTQYDKYATQYSRVFNVQNSTKGIEQFSGVSGFGLFDKNSTEGQQVTFDDVKQMFDKTYKHDTWQKGYAVSREFFDDDQFNIITNLASELGRSAALTVEYDAVTDFTNGFTTNGYDGVPLFSVSHPRVKAGGVPRNKPSVDVDFDIPNLQSALIDFAGWTDDAGKLWMVEPTRVIVPSALEFTVSEVLNSTMRSDTAENTINAFRHRDKLSPLTNFMCWRYLTDADAWFVAADPSDLKLRFLWREKFNTISDRDFYTRSLLTGGWMRFSHGWDSWAGLWGTSGG